MLVREGDSRAAEDRVARRGYLAHSIGLRIYHGARMQLLADLFDRHRRLLSRLTVGWTTFGILLFIVTPLFTPVLLVLATVAPVVWHLFCTGMPPIKPSRLTI